MIPYRTRIPQGPFGMQHECEKLQKFINWGHFEVKTKRIDAQICDKSGWICAKFNWQPKITSWIELVKNDKKFHEITFLARKMIKIVQKLCAIQSLSTQCGKFSKNNGININILLFAIFTTLKWNNLKIEINYSLYSFPGSKMPRRLSIVVKFVVEFAFWKTSCKPIITIELLQDLLEFGPLSSASTTLRISMTLMSRATSYIKSFISLICDISIIKNFM